MSSDSEGKKAPLYPLLNRPARPERKHSPLNPYYVEGSHRRTTSGSLPPGLLRLLRAYDDEEDSDSGTPPLLLPSIDVHKVSYSESDSETGVNSKFNSPNSSLFIHATPPRLHRIKETDSDATTLNELSRFIIRRPPKDEVKNRDLFHSTCSLPELPKWLDKITDGYNSDGLEFKRKSSGASIRKGILLSLNKENDKFKLSDVFSDMFLASENKAFDAIISSSRQAKCFYWKKRKPDRWIKFKRFGKKLDRPFHPFRVQNKYSNLLDSHSLVNTPSCASPVNDPTEEDYEAADDASIASSGGVLDHSHCSFSNRLVGLNIPGLKHTKSRTSTNNSNFKRIFSDGELLLERGSFKKSLVDAKNLCDSQLGMVHAEIVAVLNDEKDVSPGIVLIRKYLDNESTSILKELSIFIQRIVSFSYEELLLHTTIQRIIEDLQIIQSKLSEKRNGATGWFGIQTSMAISGVLNIIEHAQDETSVFAKGVDESDSDSCTNPKVDFGLNLESEISLDDRILCRPSFGQLPNMGGIKQNDWTYRELQDVAEEGQLLNIVIVFLKSGEISFISPSVSSVFGFNSDVIIGSRDLPFLPKETSGYHIFQTALRKLFEMDDIFIEVLFKARRSDGLAILMEAKGMLLDGVDGSVWLARPVALLGRQWKDFGADESDQPSVQSISPDCSPKLSSCLVLGESNESLNGDLALCHICDRTIPVVLFENHNAVCTNAHRAEMEIIVIQDSLESIRTQLLNQDTFLKDEVQMELLATENDPDVLKDQKLYIDCLNKLSKLSRYMMEKVDSLLLLTVQEVETAKQRVCNEDTEAINDMVEWVMPQHSDFFPSSDLKFYTEGMKLVKDQLLAMGNNLWTIACAFGASIPSFKIKLEFLRDSTHFYQLAFMQEENLKFEIGLKADKSLNDNLKDADNISLASLNITKQEQKPPDAIINQRQKLPRVSRIVVDTKKVVPVQKSDFPQSPFTEYANISRKSPHSGSSSSIIPRSEPSIRDYSIVKPISKGAYGSVYLARKKMTGDYYAIKVLKKADMIAKNQVTNVRAERLILTQLDSPYVVRLYYSFQSKNHLYLVMEYLNGGDCASLLKAVGALDENWARQYVSEMVLGLEFLHSKGVVHRDMKPDNLLIDSRGHIRITDFGLSRMGFIAHRGLKMSDKSPSESLPEPTSPYGPDSITEKTASKFLLESARISSEPALFLDVKSKGRSYQQATSVSPISPFGQFVFPKTHHRRDSIASITSIKSFCSNPEASSPEERGEVSNIFLGTPDYVAPESIMGEYQDAPVDWWAVGVILYEFLFGYPPFNADTAQKVFENILHKNIKWHDEEMDLSISARSLIESFLEMDPKKRLGSNGPDEIKSHLWFNGVDWDGLNLQDAQFVPQITDDTDTEYFDDRGAKNQHFEEDETEEGMQYDQRNRKSLKIVNIDDLPQSRDLAINKKKDSDFGGFMYRNLPLLEKANQKLVQKLKSDFIGADKMKSRTMLKLRQTTSDFPFHIRKSSSLSRAGFDSESEAFDNNSKPSTRRSRQSSVPLGRSRTDAAKRSSMSPYATYAMSKSSQVPNSPRLESDLEVLDILIADSNDSIMVDFLQKLGCRIIQVRSGPEALALALFDIKFDAIFLDSQLSIVSCENICRFVKTVSNLNQNSPIICVTSFQHTYEQIQEFDDVLSKPISFDILKQIITAIRSEPLSVRGFTF